MGWAAGFRTGTDMARGWIDTYNTANDQRRLQEIGQAKPTEIENAYTTQDAEQLRALANARDAQGNPYYNLEAGADGSYGLKTNFAYQGQDGQQVQPGGIATTFAPRASAMEFMGTRYSPEDLTPDRIDGLRSRAMADVIAERDPVRGLQMRQSIKAGERDDKRFGWEEQQQPLKQKQLEQQTRTGEIQLGQAERQVQVQQLTDEVAKMPIEALKAYASKLNTNESNLPFLMIGETKEGYKFLTIDPKTGRPMGKEFTINDAQLRELATASVLGLSGFGQESMAKLTSVNKDIADIVSKLNATTAQVVTSQNDVTSKGRADYFKEQGLNLDRERNSIARERNNLERNPLQQKIDTIEKATGKKLTEVEIKALGGLKLDEPGGLKLNKTDDGVVFTDRRGNPVGKLDPALGLVPYGDDPRTNPRTVQELERKGVKIAVAQAEDGTPVWAYASKNGRLFDNPRDAISPPMRKEDVGDLQGLRTLLDERRAQLVAAGRSGDQRVIAPLAQEVQGLQRTLTAAARERFGDRADEYLSN
jgi:hypothetical protein